MASLAAKIGPWMVVVLITGPSAGAQATKVHRANRLDRKTGTTWTTTYRLKNGVRHTIVRVRDRDSWVVKKIRDKGPV